MIKSVCNLFINYVKNERVLADYYQMDHCFDIVYHRSAPARALIDAVPPNNLRLFEMMPLLSRPYDAQAFAELTRSTSLFKLSFRELPDEQLLADKNNLFNHLMKISQCP